MKSNAKALIWQYEMKDGTRIRTETELKKGISVYVEVEGGFSILPDGEWSVESNKKQIVKIFTEIITFRIKNSKIVSIKKSKVYE